MLFGKNNESINKKVDRRLYNSIVDRIHDEAKTYPELIALITGIEDMFRDEIQELVNYKNDIIFKGALQPGSITGIITYVNYLIYTTVPNIQHAQSLKIVGLEAAALGISGLMVKSGVREAKSTKLEIVALKKELLELTVASTSIEKAYTLLQIIMKKSKQRLASIKTIYENHLKSLGITESVLLASYEGYISSQLKYITTVQTQLDAFIQVLSEAKKGIERTSYSQFQETTEMLKKMVNFLSNLNFKAIQASADLEEAMNTQCSGIQRDLGRHYSALMHIITLLSTEAQKNE